MMWRSIAKTVAYCAQAAALSSAAAVLSSAVAGVFVFNALMLETFLQQDLMSIDLTTLSLIDCLKNLIVAVLVVVLQNYFFWGVAAVFAIAHAGAPTFLVGLLMAALAKRSRHFRRREVWIAVGMVSGITMKLRLLGTNAPAQGMPYLRDVVFVLAGGLNALVFRWVILKSGARGFSLNMPSAKA